MNRKPYIVGIGGTSRPNSSSELALRQVLQDLEGMGAQVELFTGHALSKLPIYGDEVDAHDDLRESFIKALREADGVVISSPCNQGVGTVLNQLRQIVHALRGWPTPIGVGINSLEVRFTGDECSDESIRKQIKLMAKQLVQFVPRMTEATA